jgi:PRTRC genetic system protein B
MNKELTNKKFYPTSAIIINETKGEFYKQHYLESRAIVKKGGRYCFMAPVPLSEDVLKDVARSYIKDAGAEMGFAGLIPGHILYGANGIGFSIVIWYRPAMKRTLNFSASLGIKGESTVYVPATLYLVHNKSLYVFSLMTDERPDTKTKLYNAPFFNIYDGGNVCLGTAPIGQHKRKTYEEESQRFERGFYMAEQNGGNVEGRCKTPLAKLWSQLIKRKVKFPSKTELVQHKQFKTVGELIEKFIGKKHSHENEN